MARTFGEYSTDVPLGTTWEESFVLADEDGVALDLTGYKARAQLRTSKAALGAPVFELTSEGATPSMFVQPGAVAGLLTILVPSSQVSALSPNNAKLKLVWDIELYIPGTGGEDDYVIPCIQGKVNLLPRATRADLT
jgi:hypothetical protein